MTAHIQKLPSQYKEKLINELTAELSSPEAKTNHKYERRIRIVLQYYKGAPLDTLIAEGARRSSILLWSKIAREQGVKALDNNAKYWHQQLRAILLIMVITFGKDQPLVILF